MCATLQENCLQSLKSCLPLYEIARVIVSYKTHFRIKGNNRYLIHFTYCPNMYNTRITILDLQKWYALIKKSSHPKGMTSKPKNAQHQLCPHCHVCKQVFADRKQVGFISHQQCSFPSAISISIYACISIHLLSFFLYLSVYLYLCVYVCF